jgi:uncharacterized protein (DUF2249 family)
VTSIPDAVAKLRPVYLDVRGGLGARADRNRAVLGGAPDKPHEPFGRIMAAASALTDGEALVLRVPFEPVPLYQVLGARGFAHWIERQTPGDWSVWFHRADREPAGLDAQPAPRTPSNTIDVRGLEAPQPMLRILERLDSLGPGETLVVLHDRRPLFLYPQIEDRGFEHETQESGPALVRIVIRRGPS